MIVCSCNVLSDHEVRHVINSASLRFIHRDDMEAEGYGAYLDQVEDIQ